MKYATFITYDNLYCSPTSFGTHCIYSSVVSAVVHFDAQSHSLNIALSSVCAAMRCIQSRPLANTFLNKNMNINTF